MTDEVPDGWGLYHFKNNRFYKIKEVDRCCFMKSEDVSARQRRNVQLLINFIICERTNIVFAKRVLKNREIYGGKKQNDRN